MRSATKSRLLLPAHLDGGSGGGSTPGMARKQLWSQRKSLNLLHRKRQAVSRGLRFAIGYLGGRRERKRGGR